MVTEHQNVVPEKLHIPERPLAEPEDIFASPETVVSPERVEETTSRPAHPASPAQPVVTLSEVPVATPPAVAVKSPIRQQLDDVLNDGLMQVRGQMTPEEKATFDAKGVEVAGTIEILIQTMKAKARVIVDLIRGWLSLIPRVNKFFLEQESKLKTDRVLELARRRQREEPK